MILMAVVFLILMIYTGIQNLKLLFISNDKLQEKLLNKLKVILEEDKNNPEFNRQNYGEVFADNFARMYGYGAQLISGLNKIEKDNNDRIRSWIVKEKKRELFIFNMTADIITKDVHKTDLHRIKSLLDEYNNDINDPNIPPEVKKMLEDDIKELKLVLNKYLNNMGDFQNKINRTIAESLDLLEDENTEEISTTESYYKPAESPMMFENICRAFASDQIKYTGGIIAFSDSEIKENGFQFHLEDDYMTESRAAYEKMKKEIDAVTSSERSEFKKRFPNAKCSLARDKNGLYIRTHRARSKSYESVSKIPKKDEAFVSSTS